MTWTSFRVPNPGSYSIALHIANIYLPRRQPRHLSAKQSFHCSLCEVKQKQQEQKTTWFSWGRGEKMNKFQEQTRFSCKRGVSSAMQRQIMHVCRERMHDKSLFNSHTDSLWVFSPCSTVRAAACCVIFSIDGNVVCHVKTISSPASYCRDCAEVYASTKSNLKWALILGQQRNKKGRNNTTCTVNFKVYSACSYPHVQAICCIKF